MFDLPDAFARLEQPEYTGENRCYPCTAVNVALSLALAAGIGAAVSPPVGMLALGVSLALVRFRGYLVPGTPTLTRRYLPERVLERFGKLPTSEPTVETVTPAGLERVLTAAGIATDGTDGLRLTPSFRTRWDDRLSSDGTADPGASAVRSALGVDEVDRLGDASFELEGRRRVRWESTAALAADAAAAAELEGRIDGWDRLEADERRDILTGLRLLRDHCPACGGPVTATTERLGHCCRRPRIAVLAVCDECGGTLVDFSVAESRATPWLELAGAETSDGASTAD
ncbi:hypothetical protein [Natrinema sp. 1APR25-10V2]|uniref:hypothetical protein n=1 Tax=Natrinema sp. 1APR25-10V2 TaxID=2951081 RepID=UPI00287462E1|nr:hypothetical protein [Natrinema sp. 1APR25-10V2]MDS0477663.1 hypothetical protein [Natrinema sp. 1APR25-10V2]